MPAQVIDGKGIADGIRAKLKADVTQLRAHGIVPKLHVILVGERPESLTYVRVKGRACQEVGIDFELEQLPESVGEQHLIDRVCALSADRSVSGIVVQLPLPIHVNRDRILEALEPKKDVDGLTPHNLGKLVSGDETIAAATPKGIIRLLEKSGINIEGRSVVVINRSVNVGKPLLHLLLNRNATVTVCHRQTGNIGQYTRQADIVITAVGQPGFLARDMVKPGAAVIDVGLTYIGGKGMGDADFDALKDVASYITPVPGGVGPMTVAMLLENTVLAAKKQHGL